MTTLPYGGPQPPLVLSALTERERDVLEMLCDGWNYVEIAETCGVSVPAIRERASRVLTKLQARNKTHAVALAIRGGIIEAAA